MQDEIKIKGESIRTTVKYFTNFSGRSGSEDTIYYVVTDQNNKPLKISSSPFDTKFTLNSVNLNVPISAVTNDFRVYSGTVVETEYKLQLEQSDRDRIVQNFLDDIKEEANPGNPLPNPNSPFSCVFFEEYPFTDYFMNVKINQSRNTLDTLNVYNVNLNDTPRFSNNTGVLAGKLEAIQVIENEDGEKIRIPLKNVVVGIFNPSETFPNPSSTDEEGNRIRLNLYETLPQINSTNNLKGYASFQAYLTDVSFSKTDISNLTIPEEYRYTTVTNERGEFILHNLPIGQQTLMVEVDLLKFGLDPEEIALNFFPYPTQDDPNVSEIPHLFFGQYPINIVPSWGDFQTGYTEMTLSVSLDLRKWCTYQIFPISARYGQGAKNPYVMEELFAQGYSSTQTVLIRDMTKPFREFDRPKVELVKVPDIYDRNTDLRCAWNNEFKTRNNKIEYDTTAFNAFKLPANLYDPNGTNSKGEKGVWLNAYTFKVFFVDANETYNATGWANSWRGDSQIFSNHFDLSFIKDWDKNVPAGEKFAPSRIGTWPYEKPWSLTYPKDYRVTTKPKVPNPYKKWDTNGKHLTSVNGYPVEPQLEPRYLDGDLVGGKDAYATNANGFGLQDYNPGCFGNQFAREVSKNELWRYEAIDWWADEFSNGYNPGCAKYSPKYTQVPGCPSTGHPDMTDDFAEKFMRLEAGYTYWLRPSGWPRINVQNAWGDLLLRNDTAYNVPNRDSVYPGYYSRFSGIYLYLDDVTMLVGSRSRWFAKFGRITAYRVEKPYYTLPKKPPFQETFVKLNYSSVIYDGTAPGGGSNRDSSLCNLDVGCNNGSQFNPIYATGQYKAKLYNKGSIKITFEGKELFPDDSLEFTLGYNTELTLPGNSRYNPEINQYSRADYEMYYPQTCNGGCVSCNPYDNNKGEQVYLYLANQDNWGGGSNRLYRHFKNEEGTGLPAFPEDDPKGEYWLTAKIPCPVDILKYEYFYDDRLYISTYNKMTNTFGDVDRGKSYGEPWGLVRYQGLTFSANHGQNGFPARDPQIRWTRSHPSTYMGCYRTGMDGNNAGIYWRLLSDGDPWADNDLDFANIE